MITPCVHCHQTGATSWHDAETGKLCAAPCPICRGSGKMDTDHIASQLQIGHKAEMLLFHYRGQPLPEGVLSAPSGCMDAE